MKKGHRLLKEWVIMRYLDIIKYDDPLTHALICHELGIEIPHEDTSLRASLPSVKWRKLNQGKDLDPPGETL